MAFSFMASVMATALSATMLHVGWAPPSCEQLAARYGSTLPEHPSKVERRELSSALAKMNGRDPLVRACRDDIRKHKEKKT